MCCGLVDVLCAKRKKEFDRYDEGEASISLCCVDGFYTEKDRIANTGGGMDGKC